MGLKKVKLSTSQLLDGEKQLLWAFSKVQLCVCVGGGALGNEMSAWVY